jgi:pyruvate dehydrogenase E2 component (dihydrolipoamide acetyltransferase)
MSASTAHSAATRGSAPTEATTRQFLLPDLGEGLTEAEIVTWMVSVGDEVAVDQSVVEVESAKSVVELPTPYAGRVTELHAEPGTLVRTGSPLVSVTTDAAEGRVPSDTDDRDDAGGADAGTEPDHPDEIGNVDAGTEPDHQDETGNVPGTGVTTSGAVLVGYGTRESTMRLRRPAGGRFGKAVHTPDVATSLPASSPSVLLDPRRHSPVVSPIVRKFARANGFDASQLAGTGPGELVVRSDVDAAILALGVPAATEAARGHSTGPTTEAAAGHALEHPVIAEDTVIPLTGMRKIIADHLSHSRSVIPDATVWLDVDATELINAKGRLQKLTGERFSVTALVARFVVEGLKKYPILNSSVDEDAGQIVQHAAINLGMAAQTPRGLIVPVVHGTERMTTRELRDGVQDLVDRAEKGDYPPSMLAGGTFTLNNYGGFGVDGSSPIINHPEVAMLGLGRIIDRPWVVEGQIAVRKVVVLSIVFDHRVCDGDAASGFLKYVAGCIEEPLILISDI